MFTDDFLDESKIERACFWSFIYICHWMTSSESSTCRLLLLLQKKATMHVWSVTLLFKNHKGYTKRYETEPYVEVHLKYTQVLAVVLQKRLRNQHVITHSNNDAFENDLFFVTKLNLLQQCDFIFFHMH